MATTLRAIQGERFAVAPVAHTEAPPLVVLADRSLIGAGAVDAGVHGQRPPLHLPGYQPSCPLVPGLMLQRLIEMRLVEPGE